MATFKNGKVILETEDYENASKETTKDLYIRINTLYNRIQSLELENKMLKLKLDFKTLKEVEKEYKQKRKTIGQELNVLEFGKKK